MKIIILIYQIIQEKFAYGEFFILVMIGYIFMFKMMKKMQNWGLEIVAGLTRPLTGDLLSQEAHIFLIIHVEMCLIMVTIIKLSFHSKI